MIDQEILGGLRSAINRGETLEKAMITFYNAGYKKEEIEAAAKALGQEKVQQPPETIETKEIKPLVKPIKEIKKKPKLFHKIMPASKKVSSYGESAKIPPSKSKKKAGKKFLIALIIIGLVFIGLLIAFLLST